MLNLVLKFVACARAGGLRISTSEVLDCMDHLERVDVLDEPQFANVLRTNFAKSRREQSKFNHLYHLFFHELRQENNIAQTASLDGLIKKIMAMLNSHLNGDETAQAVFDFINGDPRLYLGELQQLASEDGFSAPGWGFNLGSLVRRLQLMRQLNRMGTSIAQYLEQQRSQMGWEARNDLAAYFNNRVQSARNLLSQTDRSNIDSMRQPASYQQRLDRLGTTPFASLTTKEVEEMRAVIEQLVRKLKDKATLRYSRHKRGVLDVKRTLRRSARFQGIPMEIVHRHRLPRRGKIVTLCDVSNSVWSAARFMLNMLYSLQECFTQVRTFVFVDGLDEVTRVFENHEINQAIEKVLKEAEVNYSASTDYGRTFREFKQKHMDILNKKTTLIIIGDARSNYLNPEENILDVMRERSRRVVWLNPETKMFWNSGDSEMRVYQPYCHEVRLCQNLDQLLAFIHELVL